MSDTPKKYVGIVCPFAWGEATFMVCRLREFIQRTGREVWVFSTVEPAYRAKDFERDSQIVDPSMISFTHFAKNAEHLIFFSISNHEYINIAFEKRCRLSLVLMWNQFTAKDLLVLSLFDNVMVPHREAAECFKDSVFGHYAELDWGTNAPYADRDYQVKRNNISVVHTGSNKGDDAVIALKVCQDILRIYPTSRVNLITAKRGWQNDQKRLINVLTADYGFRFSFIHRCSRAQYLDELSRSELVVWPTFAVDSPSVIYDVLACGSSAVVFDMPMFRMIESPNIVRVPCLLTARSEALMVTRPAGSPDMAGRLVEAVQKHYNKQMSSDGFEPSTYRMLTEVRQAFEGYWLGNLNEVPQTKHRE